MHAAARDQARTIFAVRLSSACNNEQDGMQTRHGLSPTRLDWLATVRLRPGNTGLYAFRDGSLSTGTARDLYARVHSSMKGMAGSLALIGRSGR